jgi:hypothetical protein
MPLDDRLRQVLDEEAAGIEPDVERQLALVRGRARQRGMPARRLVLAVAAMTAVVLFAWGAAIDPMGVLDPVREPSSVSAPGASTTPLVGEAPLVGTYRATLAETDGTVDRSIVGDWELTFHPASHLAVVPPDTFVAAHQPSSGADVYAIDGDLLYTNLFARQLGPDCASAGTYRWHVETERLTLEKVDDMCRQRVAVLTGREWARLGE